VERERVETALQVERERFNQLFDDLPVYLILMTPDYHVALDNRFFRERFGESGGRRCYEYLFNRTEPCEICETYKVLKTGQPLQWEWTGPDGRNYFIFDFPYTDVDGSPLIMEVGIDITARKQAEQALERHQHHLEELVEERTRSLEDANRQLLDEINERKRAEATLLAYALQLKASNQALDDFALVASHDLQEPLRKIHGFGSHLKTRHSRELDEEGQDYLNRMLAAADRMNSMLEGLLAYSRVSSQGKRFEQIDLRQVAEEVLIDLEIRIQQSHAQVDIGPLAVVEADPLQMRQVFQNLLGNALKFHRPGVSPHIRVTSARDAAGRIEIRVQDNGAGFDEAHLDLLFKPFHRLHRRSEYSGNGLGLAIVKKILDRHGGSITATSKVGQGSTFILTLPEAQPGKVALQ
jgi:signal transduction histidine kinase